ncbi:LytTR family DNA-binding domain-containing protein [Flavobacterium sp.]|uniref:LytR/AlgR family response regulator transcription factor n=1 Tax=Flavobacterium sp. TaxID=239 RepID=UPI0012265FA5|nr:LytTR family DNA-binding domain-containing protein [Flavobacterium sp.]RZJ72491.1 MAG: response regulator transcription factor [Flavobacterium sp.]
MKHDYIIISDNRHDIAETKAVAAVFPQLSFVGSASNFDEGLDLVLEKNPKIVFLEIQPEDVSSKLGLSFISELFRFLNDVPKVIVTAKNADLAYEALRYDVLDYFVTPFRSLELRKCLMRLEKSSAMQPVIAFQTTIEAPATETDLPTSEKVIEQIESDSTKQAEVELITLDPVQIVPEIHATPVEKPLVICVKSYGDYRFIEARDICYIQADNNSADIHLNNGEMITAFKTLKQFENALPAPFVRIHNSHIVNMDYVSRIHTGNSVCYLKNTAATKLPFSKSYKENVDLIINSISNGNYLEF